MTKCEDFIEHLAETLPDPCTPKDLVRVGIFSSANVVTHARKANRGPAYIQLDRRGKVFYPRDGVIDWLKGSVHERPKNS